MLIAKKDVDCELVVKIREGGRRRIKWGDALEGRTTDRRGLRGAAPGKIFRAMPLFREGTPVFT